MGLGGTGPGSEGLEHSQDIRFLCRAVFKQRNGSERMACFPRNKPGVVVYAHNPSTWEADVELP